MKTLSWLWALMVYFQRHPFRYLIIAFFFVGTSGSFQTANAAIEGHSFSNPKEIQVVQTDLVISVNFEEKRLAVTATITAKRRHDSATHLILDTHGLDIESIEGDVLEYSFEPGLPDQPFLGTPLRIKVSEERLITLVIRYKTSPDAPGLVWPNSPNSPEILYTRNETINARSWFPCQDIVSESSNFSAVFTSSHRSIVAGESPFRIKSRGKNKQLFQFLMPSHLFGFIVGNFENTRLQNGRKIYFLPEDKESVDLLELENVAHYAKILDSFLVPEYEHVAAVDLILLPVIENRDYLVLRNLLLVDLKTLLVERLWSENRKVEGVSTTENSPPYLPTLLKSLTESIIVNSIELQTWQVSWIRYAWTGFLTESLVGAFFDPKDSDDYRTNEFALYLLPAEKRRVRAMRSSSSLSDQQSTRLIKTGLELEHPDSYQDSSAYVKGAHFLGKTVLLDHASLGGVIYQFRKFLFVGPLTEERINSRLRPHRSTVVTEAHIQSWIYHAGIAPPMYLGNDGDRMAHPFGEFDSTKTLDSEEVSKFDFSRSFIHEVRNLVLELKERLTTEKDEVSRIIAKLRSSESWARQLGIDPVLMSSWLELTILEGSWKENLNELQTFLSLNSARKNIQVVYETLARANSTYSGPKNERQQLARRLHQQYRTGYSQELNRFLKALLIHETANL